MLKFDLIRGVFGHRKTFVKKRTEIHFSMFIESPNWDLKFVFQFDNENEKRKKKSKLYFILKQKSNVPFDPRIELESNPCTESIILFSNLIEIENWQFLVFLFSILN